EDAPRPERKEDEILVRVIAAGVNPVDGMIRAGMFAKNSKNAFPMVPGYDIAGIVEETGAKIDKYKTGDAVYAYIGLNKGGDYTKQKFEDIAKDVDVVLDTIGEDTLARSYGVVKKGGFIVSLVARPDRAELEKHGIRGAPMSVVPNSDELAEITKLIDAKKVK